MIRPADGHRRALTRPGLRASSRMVWMASTALAPKDARHRAAASWARHLSAACHRRPQSL